MAGSEIAKECQRIALQATGTQRAIENGKSEEDVMAIQQIERASRQATKPSGNIRSSFYLWRENKELLLAGVTLVALLFGWVGGSLTGVLPAWAVTLAALVAFAAGGYSGLMGAIEEAKQGKHGIGAEPAAGDIAPQQPRGQTDKGCRGKQAAGFGQVSKL